MGRLFNRESGESDMAIGNAIQRGSFVYVYDEKGRQIARLSAGNAAKGDGLTGYTSTTVNVKRGAYIYTYNEQGRQISRSGS
jgi:hypothetical protein